MKEDVYIFIGQSGSGKGTQAKLLKEKLESKDPSKDVFYLETGSKFRELLTTDNFTAMRTGAMMAEGKLPPSFLGIHMWSHEMIEKYNGMQAVIIDGAPRVIYEVPVILSAATFYDWHPHVFNLLVKDEWSYERIKGRGRADDKAEHDIWGRIEWFHESVEPALQQLRESELVTFHDIEGEKSIEAVHKDICEILGL